MTAQSDIDRVLTILEAVCKVAKDVGYCELDTSLHLISRLRITAQRSPHADTRTEVSDLPTSVDG